MQRTRRFLPSPAMVVAVVALSVALSGSAYAGARLASDGGGGDGQKVAAAKRNGAERQAAAARPTAIAVRALVERPGWNIPNGQSVALKWTGEEFDTANMHTNVGANNTKLVAPETGIYHIAAAVTWDPVDPNGRRQLWLRKNGAGTLFAGAGDVANTVAGLQEQRANTYSLLRRGDYVEALVWQGTGAANQILMPAEFSLVFVGPEK